LVSLTGPVPGAAAVTLLKRSSGLDSSVSSRYALPPVGSGPPASALPGGLGLDAASVSSSGDPPASAPGGLSFGASVSSGRGSLASALPGRLGLDGASVLSGGDPLASAPGGLSFGASVSSGRGPPASAPTGRPAEPAGVASSPRSGASSTG
jgi:hypothetical protein